MKLKYPDNNLIKLDKQHNFVRKEDDINLIYPTIEPTDTSIALGSVTTILYATLFIYIYTTASLNNNGKNSLSWTDFSLSRAFEYSEKTGTTILIVMTMCFFSFFLKEQNMFGGNDPYRNIIVIVVFSLMAGLLLLFTVLSEQWKSHLAVTLLIMLSLSILAMFINISYHEYYEEESLEEIHTSSWICLSTVIISLVAVIGKAVVEKMYGNSDEYLIVKLSKVIFYILEIVVIVSFLVTLGMFASYPKLIDDDLVKCVISS